MAMLRTPSLRAFSINAQPGVVVEEEALAVRPPLRVGLPRGDLVLLGEHVHGLEVARLVGIDAPVQ